MRHDKQMGFTMEDVIVAMEAIEIESGGKVTLDCERYAGSNGRQRVMWTATLVAKPTGAMFGQTYIASQGWPTNTHKTVLALLWSLLHSVDQQFQAADHLSKV